MFTENFTWEISAKYVYFMVSIKQIRFEILMMDYLILQNSHSVYAELQ